MGSSDVASETEYVFNSSESSHTHAYLWDPILKACARLGAKSVFDLGCGNGSFCKRLGQQGFSVAGCDISESGVAQARQALPDVDLRVLGVDDDPAVVGRSDFDVVTSLEVVEHLFAPRSLPRFASALLKPGGHLIVSTPYHGFFKNLVLALTNKWDSHHDPLWNGGHIKFWSRPTLTKLLETEGFQVTEFIGAGRFPFMWKSMIIVAKKIR
ncbi:class I SAM-dependent methyltransferase [soil metagenome]